MKRIIKSLTGLITLTAIILICSNCAQNNVNTIGLPTIRYVEPIEDIVPEALLKVMNINYGYDPPILNGGFIAKPYMLRYSSIPQDSIGYIWPSRHVKFFKQAYENTISYESEQGTESVYCPTAYIQGSGDNFTVYFNELRTDNNTGNTLLTASVITGSVTAGGIANFEYGFIMIESDNNHNVVGANTVRVFKDKDNLAQNYNW